MCSYLQSVTVIQILLGNANPWEKEGVIVKEVTVSMWLLTIDVILCLLLFLQPQIKVQYHLTWETLKRLRYPLNPGFVAITIMLIVVNLVQKHNAPKHAIMDIIGQVFTFHIMRILIKEVHENEII